MRLLDPDESPSYAEDRGYRPDVSGAGHGLFTMSPDAILVESPTGALLDANPSASRMFGWSREELLARGLSVLLDPRDPHLRHLLGGAAPSPAAVTGALHLRRRDGSIAPVTAWVVETQDPRVRRLWIFRDDSDRYRLRLEMLELQERLHLLSDAVAEALVVHERGRILEVNRSFETLFGRTPQEVVGRDLWDLVDPADRDRIRSRILEARETTTECGSTAGRGRPVRIELRSRPFWYRGAWAAITVCRDVTGRALLERMLREAEERYRDIFEHTVIGIFHVERDGLVLVNPSFAALLGYDSPEELLGRVHRFRDLVLEPDRLELARRSILETGRILGFEILLRRKDGTSAWMAVNARLLRGPEGVLGVEGTLLDVTRRRQESAKMQFLAYHDRLTGLRNRSAFEEHLQAAVARARRNRNGVAVLFMDVDNLKETNDHEGHGAGDVLLMEAAARLLVVSRESDTIARIGGDEFAVLVADLPLDSGGGTQQAEQMIAGVIRRIRASLGEGPAPPRSSRPISMSIGWSLMPRDASGAEQLLGRADAAMYREKRRKKEAGGSP